MTRSDYYRAIRQIDRAERDGYLTADVAEAHRGTIKARFLRLVALRRQYEAGQLA